jgi:hypothetical protein
MNTNVCTHRGSGVWLGVVVCSTNRLHTHSHGFHCTHFPKKKKKKKKKKKQFGYEDLLLKLTGPNAKIATSKLGLGYAKGPGGMASLFAPSEGKTAEIVDLKVYVVAR